MYILRGGVDHETPVEAWMAPDKGGQQIEGSMREVCTRVQTSLAERRESVRAAVFAPAGQSTQMIIGATPSTDADILRTAESLVDRRRINFAQQHEVAQDHQPFDVVAVGIAQDTATDRSLPPQRCS